MLKQLIHFFLRLQYCYHNIMILLNAFDHGLKGGWGFDLKGVFKEWSEGWTRARGEEMGATGSIGV